MNNIEGPIVAKFGGSSMADVNSIKNVAEIVRSDPDRRFIVVSAPGRNGQYPGKMTDLLMAVHSANTQYKRRRAFDEFTERVLLIGEELGSTHLAQDCVEQVRSGIDERRSEEWFKSRGEWSIARISADFFGATFVDAQELIRIRTGGQIDILSYELVRERLASRFGRLIIPGFYGLNGKGEVTTFQRGGSDVTGAIIARGVKARVYENWTNVDGVLSANPKIVDRPAVVRHITYEEIRELGVRGVEVLQRDTILPLIQVGTPINLRNTFNPEDKGTIIEAQRPQIVGEHVIGIASEGPFASFGIQKFGMNDEIGIGRDILEIFRQSEIPYEHNPSGKDYMSVIVNQDRLDDSEAVALVGYLNHVISPDRVVVQRNLGLLSLVGQGIQDYVGVVSGRLFSALDEAQIPVKAYTFGTSGISIVVAVNHDRLEEAVRLAHDLFIK